MSICEYGLIDVKCYKSSLFFSQRITLIPRILAIFLFFISSCFLFAEEREALIPFPIPPGEEVILSFGLFGGEMTLYLGVRGSVWRYGLISRRWARLIAGNEPVVEILGNISHEGAWVLTENQALYLSSFLRKPVTLSLPSAKGGDWSGDQVLLAGENLLLQGSGTLLKREPYPPGLSSAVLYQGKRILLQSSGTLITKDRTLSSLDKLKDENLRDLKRCEDDLFALDDEGWVRILPQPLPQPWRGVEVLCALGGGGILLTHEGLFYAPSGTFIGRYPHGAIGRGSAVIQGNAILLALPFPQGIQLIRYSLKPEENRPSSLTCLKPLDEILLAISRRTTAQEEHLKDWLRRSRSAGWIPRIKIGGDLDRTLGLTLEENVPYSTSTERGVVLIGPSLSTLDRTARWNYTARVELNWELDRLLFSDDETRIVTAWERLVRERERELLFAQTLWMTLSRRESTPEEREGARALLLTLWGVDPLFPSPECQKEFQRKPPP